VLLSLQRQHPRVGRATEAEAADVDGRKHSRRYARMARRASSVAAVGDVVKNTLRLTMWTMVLWRTLAGSMCAHWLV
jgi:hypothetical protein